jgi:hypothetical protein
MATDTTCTDSDVCCDGAACGAFGADGARVCGFASDAAVPRSDAATVTTTHCTASGNPCTSAAECCEGAYCGAFSASSGSNVCGSDTPDVISTGSCSLGGSTGIDGLGFVALVGFGCRISLRRKRRSSSSYSAAVGRGCSARPS